jgi:hypothetical protein
MLIFTVMGDERDFNCHNLRRIYLPHILTYTDSVAMLVGDFVLPPE